MRISDWSSDVCSSDLHSPDALDVLWLQLDQNRYRKDARGAFTGGKFPTEFTDGYKIASVAVEDAHGNKQPVKWVVSDTRMQVQLPTRSEEHTSELQSLMRISYAVFCLKKKKNEKNNTHQSWRQMKHKQAHNSKHSKRTNSNDN